MITEVIPPALAGERLDRVVALVTSASRSAAAALVADGGVTVDGAIERSGKSRLTAGQVVVIDPSLLPVAVPPAADPSVDLRVVHADDDVIVVDKPAGLVVHPGAGHPGGTLVNGLLHRYPDIAEVGEVHRPGIVHRLDVGTSGLMLVARSAVAHAALSAALASRDVTRRYLALVWGALPNDHGVIDAPIGRDHRDPMRMAVVVDGRPARTHFAVVSRFTTVEASLLECRLETGRTHQIRVHLAATGHPVVGDGTYGGVRAGIDCPRPFLHSAAVAFTHPVTGERLQFDSELPPDLTAVVSALGPID